MSRTELEPMDNTCSKETSLISLAHNLESHSGILMARINALLELFNDQRKGKCEEGAKKSMDGPSDDIFSTLHRTYNKLDALINVIDCFQERIGYYKEINGPQCAIDKDVRR